MSSSTSSETYLHSHAITHTWTVHNCGRLRLRSKVSLCSTLFPAQWDEPRFQLWLTTDVDYYGYENASVFVETKSLLQGSFSLALRDPTGRDIAQTSCNTKAAARITCEKKALLGGGGAATTSNDAVLASAACGTEENDRFSLIVLFKFEYMTDRSGGPDEPPGSPLLGLLPGILDSASFGDVEIRVGQRSLRAHSDLLGRLSPVFAAMLTGETREATGRVIVIEDLSYEAVRQLVEYLYAGTLSGLVHGAADLYAAADKYGVSQVKQACARQLSNALTPDNALRVFELAVRHSDRDLSRDSARFIDAHLPEVQASDAWETLLKDDSLTLALFKCAARYQTTRADASSASSSSTNV
ncbi:TD and POZ domain-containing protein 4-like [Ixodes scapularis]|uniref:TD and POZ domain-containing protein 4-like n=1 Tax=Ixodes scapularis TaxID=6945 RepID=UPI001A9EBE14|nr:TD and POZ domain-containing protein 4-like [Ixodes scapularis]